MVSAKRVLLLVFLTLCFASVSRVPSSASDLTEALKLRDVAKVRSLLAAGADANEEVRRDYPLNIAAAYGPAEMVTLLLEAGAKLEQPGRDGQHPLHNAVNLGHTDIVALLIGKGAPVNAKDKRGRTPLYNFACTGGSDIEIARTLLAAGADPKIIDAEYLETPLNCAADTGNLELAELLIAARVDVNHGNVDSWTALHVASYRSRHKFAKLLIAAGADVNLKNKAGHTSLFYAQDEAMKQLLIEAGAK
jgi:uncharacterized protein